MRSLPFLCSPTEEKLYSKSRPLTYNELEDCADNSKQLYAEFWVSVDLFKNIFFIFNSGGKLITKIIPKMKFPVNLLQTVSHLPWIVCWHCFFVLSRKCPWTTPLLRRDYLVQATEIDIHLLYQVSSTDDWLHWRISPTDSKVKTKLFDIINSTAGMYIRQHIKQYHKNILINVT